MGFALKEAVSRERHGDEEKEVVCSAILKKEKKSSKNSWI